MNNEHRDNLRRKLLRLLLSRIAQGRPSPSGVGDKPNNNSSDQSTNHNAQKNSHEENPRLHLKDAFVGVIEAAVGGGFFGLLGEILDALGFHGFKMWCSLAGFAAVEFALAHLLVKALRRRRIWLIWASVVILEFLAFGIGAHLQSKRKVLESMPRFRIVFQTAGASPFRVELTNTFLRITKFGSNDFPRGVVFVPKDVPQSDVRLRLFLWNDSPWIAEHGQGFTSRSFGVRLVICAYKYIPQADRDIGNKC